MQHGWVPAIGELHLETPAVVSDHAKEALDT